MSFQAKAKSLISAYATYIVNLLYILAEGKTLIDTREFVPMLTQYIDAPTVHDIYSIYLSFVRERTGHIRIRRNDLDK